MRAPYSLDTAKRLKDKGLINEDHYNKISKMFSDNVKVQRLATKGYVDDENASPSKDDVEMGPPATDANDAVDNTDVAGFNSQPITTPEPGQSSQSSGLNLMSGDPYNAAVQGMAQGTPSMAGNAPSNTEAIKAAAAGATEGASHAEPAGKVVPATERTIIDNTNKFPSFNPLAGYEMQQAGIGTELQAAEARAKEQAAAQNAAADKMQGIADARQENMNKQAEFVAKQTDALNAKINEYSATKIDTNRYWAEKSTGDKILAGIGLFLGSFGGEGGNRAAQVIQDNIKRDIQAQETQAAIKQQGIQNHKSLYSEMLALYKDKDAAMAASQVAALNIAQMRLNAVSSRYSAPEAKGKAQQLYGQLEQQKQAAGMQFQQAVLKMQAMQDPGGSYREFLDKDQRERIVPGYKGFAVSSDAAKNVLDANASHLDAEHNIKELLKINEQSKLGKTIDPDTLAQARVYLGALQGHMARGTFGRVSEQELDLVKNMIADPTKITSLQGATRKGLETLLSSSKQAVDAKAKAAGLVPYNDAMGLKTMSEPPSPIGASGSKSGIQPVNMRK